MCIFSLNIRKCTAAGVAWSHVEPYAASLVAIGNTGLMALYTKIKIYHEFMEESGP